ncbi:hypothetical protein SpCBS45565_g07458 [Spizellomyces sp. 'palustris']|nr:hypothetical protein SpCBS45565_g07458 [Spizellomyces sp. 'palustris']
MSSDADIKTEYPSAPGSPTTSVTSFTSEGTTPSDPVAEFDRDAFKFMPLIVRTLEIMHRADVTGDEATGLPEEVDRMIRTLRNMIREAHELVLALPGSNMLEDTQRKILEKDLAKLSAKRDRIKSFLPNETEEKNAMEMD